MIGIYDRSSEALALHALASSSPMPSALPLLEPSALPLLELCTFILISMIDPGMTMFTQIHVGDVTDLIRSKVKAALDQNGGDTRIIATASILIHGKILKNT